MAGEIIDVDEDHIVGSYSALLVLMWGKYTRAEKLARVIPQGKAFMERWPRIAVLVLVEPDAELPNREARVKLEEFTRLLLNKITAIVYVYQGTGIRASATRTLMTMLMMLGKSPLHYRVARTIDEGMDWLVPHLAGPEFGNEAERRKAVKAFHQHFIDYRAKLQPRSAELSP